MFYPLFIKIIVIKSLFKILLILYLLVKVSVADFSKKSLKMSPYDYLINYRINESMKLLKNTSFSILDIAENVGFNNVSHYIQIFKKENRSNTT